MLLNNSLAWRQPRLRVLANGILLPGVIEADITSNNHYAADRFRLTAALGAAPVGAANVFSDTGQIAIDIAVSIDGGGSFTSLLQGVVDSVLIDPVLNTLSLRGRDYTSGLIEARTQETFANQTSSDIATTLATRHALVADVQATTTPVGRYWQLEHDRITLDAFARAISEWDLLVALARIEGFDVWIDGTTLHFRPGLPQSAPVAVLRPIATLSGPANVTSLHLERTLTLARDIEVTVKSWNSRQQTAFVQTARASRTTPANTQGQAAKPQSYVYVVPNLTPDRALALAQSRLAELSRHERVILAEMPGDITLTPRQQLRLEGTGTAFDQIYWIDEIDRHIHAEHGFTQRLRARNATPGSQTTAPADPAALAGVV